MHTQHAQPAPPCLGSRVLDSLPPSLPPSLRARLQVQGVLSSAAERWPHIKISDSLVMADGAVKMAEAGCK